MVGGQPPMLAHQALACGNVCPSYHGSAALLACVSCAVWHAGFSEPGEIRRR